MAHIEIMRIMSVWVLVVSIDGVVTYSYQADRRIYCEHVMEALTMRLSEVA